jgi:hypothetical protein
MFKKRHVTNKMKQKEDDVLWEEYHEENSPSSSDKSVDSQSLTQSGVCKFLLQ